MTISSICHSTKFSQSPTVPNRGPQRVNHRHAKEKTLKKSVFINKNANTDKEQAGTRLTHLICRGAAAVFPGRHKSKP